MVGTCKEYPFFIFASSEPLNTTTKSANCGSQAYEQIPSMSLQREN